MKPSLLKFSCSLVGAAWAAAMSLSAQSSPYRGLWVGEVILDRVNEVAVPLDDRNVPRAPDPKVPTPTFDSASLRLIIHVDAAGQASLLKQVAILARKAGVQEKESDLALVTDERLYGAFPPQPATRISSVVFDYGDAKATAAVNEVVERAATAAAAAAALPGATEATVRAAAQQAAAPVIAQADAAQAFSAFLQGSIAKSQVIAIADGGSAAAARAAATVLRDGSFYGDLRGIEMVDAIEAAMAALPPSTSSAARRQVALNTAAAFAETNAGYDRFLASQSFGDMISAAAEEAAKTAGTLALKPITAFNASGGGTTVDAVSNAHGLLSGNEVAIQGAAVAAYNGLHQVTQVDANTFRLAVTPVAGGAVAGYSAARGTAPLRVASTGHGLTSGARVTIRGSLAAYNGPHLVTVLDADTFTINVPFESDPADRGVWSVKFGDIVSYQGTPDGSSGVKIVSPNHGLDNGQRIEIHGAGSASYNGVKVITRIDDNSFSIPQAFAGDPPIKGAWDLPVVIEGVQPPAELPTLIEAATHGLTSDDRIVISGSGKPEYNGEFTVTVVDSASFTIPVLYDDATGNPATKGTWQPAAGGQWRTTAPIRSTVDGVAKVDETRVLRARAGDVTVAAYDDTRAVDAVELVLNEVIRAAAVAESPLTEQVKVLAAQAGVDALASLVARYPRPSTVPSTDYTEFVKSPAFAASVATAAGAAATGALKEKENIIATPSSIRDKALTAAIDALTPVFATASRSMLTALPMSGAFGPGSSGLHTDLVLPANHPTNPFRHRRHPDHTVGFDITRSINLMFQPADEQPVGQGSVGVDRLIGNYDEEIIGLHKNLGPARDTGLRVGGRFQLSRISLIDTLNGR